MSDGIVFVVDRKAKCADAKRNIWIVVDEPLRHMNKSNARYSPGSPKARRDWRTLMEEQQAVAIAARLAARSNLDEAKEMFDAKALSVTIRIVFGNLRVGPRLHRAEVRFQMCDVDGIKGVLDGMEGWLFRNDRQVTQLVVEKRYDPNQEGDRLEIYCGLAEDFTPLHLVEREACETSAS